MDNKRIEELYLAKDYNCAETVLRYFNDVLGLEITDEDLKLIGGFGGGMGCGRTCGALAAAIAVIGRTSIRERAHEDPAFKEKCGAFTALFLEKEGSIDCTEVKARNFVEGVRCLRSVTDTVEALEGFLGL